MRSAARVHLVSLPMDDLDENAAMVNALQRRADIVVQKSLAEGFGLTVAEAMWKRRPVIGTRVGGIQDQIVDGVSGLLVDDPRDLRRWRSRDRGRSPTTRARPPSSANALASASAIASWVRPGWLSTPSCLPSSSASSR